MAEESKPIPPPEPQSAADSSTDARRETSASTNGIVEDVPESALEDAPNAPEKDSRKDMPSKGGNDSRTDAKQNAAGDFGGSDTPTRSPGTIRRKWILPVIVGTALISAGIGGVAVFLAKDPAQQEIQSVVDGLEARITEHEAELAERSAQIDDLRAALAAADSQIAGLKTAWEENSARIAELRAMIPDGTAIEVSVRELRNAGEAAMSEFDRFDAALTALRDRIDSVEAQPIPIGALPEEIADAYDRQFAEILSEVDDRFAEMQEALAGRLAEINAARAAAAQSEQDARLAETTAAARGALARIVLALDSGKSFAEEVGLLQETSGLAPPVELFAVAEDGVPTRDELAEAFPEAARLALDAATADAVENGNISSMRAFLRSQLGLRSLEPREGDSPDAVLSRAESAVRADDLDAALAEIAALPQAGRDRFADWIMLAELRRGALGAVTVLSAQIGK